MWKYIKLKHFQWNGVTPSFPFLFLFSFLFESTWKYTTHSYVLSKPVHSRTHHWNLWPFFTSTLNKTAINYNYYQSSKQLQNVYSNVCSSSVEGKWVFNFAMLNKIDHRHKLQKGAPRVFSYLNVKKATVIFFVTLAVALNMLMKLMMMMMMMNGLQAERQYLYTQIYLF